MASAASPAATAAPASLGRSAHHASLRTHLRKRHSILVRRLRPKPGGSGGEAAPVLHEHVHHHHIFGHPVPHAHAHGGAGHAHGHGHGAAAAATPPRRPVPGIAATPPRQAVPGIAVSDERLATPAPTTPSPPRARTPLRLMRRAKDRAVSEPLTHLAVPEPDDAASSASSLRSATPAPSIGHRRTLSNKMLSLVNFVRRGRDDKSPLGAVAPVAPATPLPPATPPASILGPRVPPARPHRSPDTASFITTRPRDSPSPDDLVPYRTPGGVFEARTAMPDPRPFGRARDSPPADLVSHFSDSTESSGILTRRRRRARRNAAPLSSQGSLRARSRSPTSFQYSVGSSKSSSFRVPWRGRRAGAAAPTPSDGSRRDSASSAASSSHGSPLSPAPPFAAPPSPPTPSRRVSSAARHDSHASARIRTPSLRRIKVWSHSMPELLHQHNQHQHGQHQHNQQRLRKPRAKKDTTIRRRRSSLDL